MYRVQVCCTGLCVSFFLSFFLYSFSTTTYDFYIELLITIFAKHPPVGYEGGGEKLLEKFCPQLLFLSYPTSRQGPVCTSIVFIRTDRFWPASLVVSFLLIHYYSGRLAERLEELKMRLTQHQVQLEA